MNLGDVKRKLSCELALRFDARRSVKKLEGRYVTFTFDDFPLSAAVAGTEILDDHGVKGTFYCASSLCSTTGNVGLIADLSEVRRLQTEGHEIGCHTYLHRDCSKISHAELTADLKLNRKNLDFCPLESFAFPFGYWDWGSRRVVAKDFRTVRTGVRGINRGHVDLSGLKAVPLTEGLGKGGFDSWLDKLQDDAGWLILYGHDVVAQPSRFGCTPELLTYCVEQAVKAGYSIETVGQVAGRVS